MKTAFIFPAFVTEYIGNELALLEQLSAGFPEYLIKVSELTGDNYNCFSENDPNFIENELQSQLISYTFGCCLADALMAKKRIPDLMAGYSMGLYAALYTGKAIRFEEGIRLIEKAYQLSQEAIRGKSAGMGSIIGLTAEEINSLIREHDLQVGIANVNSRHAVLVTGLLDDLKQLLLMAEEEGALHVTRLLVETPYHSRLLERTQNKFGNFIQEQISLKNSQYPLISSVDQRLFSWADEIKKELTNNLFRPLDWQKTFEKMLQKDIQQFVECGAGKSLRKISRFAEGDFTVYPMDKIGQILAGN